MDVIDFRSDTVTRPTRPMREAMANAEVGDDYYREDPTVNKLEALAAELLKKEAALLVLSGTMGNLVSILCWAERGSCVLADERAHIINFESGHLAGVGGITTRTFRGKRGFPSADEVRSAVFPANIQRPPVRALCLENTHNAAGGTCLGVAETAALAKAAAMGGMKVHVDGARIFNAAVALNVDTSTLVANVDSTTFCLTKGLGCPVGSLIVGSSDFIANARRWRQHLGGNMRQAGVFAAAGIVGLQTMRARLKEDHDNAKYLAARLADLGWPTDPRLVETNILFVDFGKSDVNAQKLVDALRSEGVLINPPRGNRVRFVTHNGLTHEDIRTAVDIAARVHNQLFRKVSPKGAVSHML